MMFTGQTPLSMEREMVEHRQRHATTPVSRTDHHAEQDRQDDDRRPGYQPRHMPRAAAVDGQPAAERSTSASRLGGDDEGDGLLA
jgi:hypothetical protein